MPIPGTAGILPALTPQRSQRSDGILAVVTTTNIAPN